jgi:hypothetical protein
MIERGEKTRQVTEKIGGASRDRTDDLIVANDGVRQIICLPCLHLAAEYGPLRSNSEPARLELPQTSTIGDCDFAPDVTNSLNHNLRLVEHNVMTALLGDPQLALR